MKYLIFIIMVICCASVNNGYVDGVTLGDGFTGTIITMAYAGWLLR